jgi:hypothetical protein
MADAARRLREAQEAADEEHARRREAERGAALSLESPRRPADRQRGGDQ